MRIGEREIGPHQPPYIVAELGVNHDGSLDRALALVEAAHQAGADAVKFQWFQAGDLLSRAGRLTEYQSRSGARDPREMLQSRQLDGAQFATILDHSHALGLQAIVTVFSDRLVAHAAALVWDAYKTASPDVINRPLLEALMATGKPLLVSTGAATLAEIKRASEWLGGHPHILMQCVSAYPTPDDSACLAGRAAMCAVNPHALGYSDHTTAVDTGALAVASGACVLEKHLTHDRTAAGPDHASSLDPKQFRTYVELAHRAHRMLGPAEKRVLDLERDVREAARQSLATRRALPAGHLLRPEDLTIKRPGVGIEPCRLAETVGRRLTRSVEADMPLLEDALE